MRLTARRLRALTLILAATIAAHCVPFLDYKDRPKLRQCLDCWARDGWARSDYGGSVFGGSPVDAMRLLDRTDPNRHIYRISTEEARTHTLEAA